MALLLPVLQELQRALVQVQMDVQDLKGGNRRLGMNPAAVPYVPVDQKATAPTVEVKSVAEPARNEKHAGSAVETGPSPVKSEPVLHSSPVVSARSSDKGKPVEEKRSKMEPAASPMNPPAAPVRPVESKAAVQEPVVKQEHKTDSSVLKPAVDGSPVVARSVVAASDEEPWMEQRKMSKSGRRAAARAAANAVNATNAVPAAVWGAAPAADAIAHARKADRKLFEEKHRQVLWMVNSMGQPEDYQLDEHSDMGEAVRELKALKSLNDFHCKCVRCPVWWDEKLGREHWLKEVRPQWEKTWRGRKDGLCFKSMLP
jgi:hypothetical protein